MLVSRPVLGSILSFGKSSGSVIAAAVFLVHFGLGSSTANAENRTYPFGFKNIHPSKIRGCAKSKSQTEIWHCKDAPRPHSKFESYALYYVEKIGLCKIWGVGKTISGDRFGIKIRSAAGDIVAQLSKRYGPPPDKFDYLHSGSIWDDSDEWMMALKLKQRSYVFYWTEPEFSPVDDISSIQLRAYGLRSDAGYLQLNFETNFMDRCAKSKKGKDEKAF